MRLLILTKNYPPRSCGVGDYAHRLAQEFTAVGDSVTVLTEPAAEPRHLAISLRELPLRGWRDLRPVVDAVAASAPDRVQLEYSAYGWGRWGTAWWVNALLFRLRRRGIPVHVGLHELAISMRRHPLQTPLAMAQWLHIALIVSAAKTVAVNMRSRAVLLERLFPWWREKIRYRPNSSNISVVPMAQAGKESFRRERGVAPGELVVATFGLLHPAKNYEGLIEAAAHVRQSIPAKLWMLGDRAAASPEYVARLERLARELGIEQLLWWPGRLEPAEISRALQAADVFVLPQSDGQLTRSGAFMAAAAHGLPVVAVRQPGGRDQMEFTHGQHLWLVEHSTPEELSAGIRALASDREAASRMGCRLRELYAARFDWRVTAAAGCAAAANLPAAVADPEPTGRRPVAAGPVSAGHS